METVELISRNKTRKGSTIIFPHYNGSRFVTAKGRVLKVLKHKRIIVEVVEILKMHI